MDNELIGALRSGQRFFGIDLNDGSLAALDRFHRLILEGNEFLHLVAPCPAEEFATRHILESLALLEHLPENASFADIGPGGGFPSIPCLIVRSDLRAVLIESKRKKSGFLENAVLELGLETRATIVNRQFEEISATEVDFVVCRALDKFSDKLPRLLRWADGRPLRLFGGPSIEAELVKARIRFESKLLPLSDRRFLFVCGRTEPRQRIVNTR